MFQRRAFLSFAFFMSANFFSYGSDQEVREKRRALRNILLSEPFFDPLINKGSKVLSVLRGVDDAFPQLLKEESQFFFFHVDHLLSNSRDPELLFNDLSDFLLYYNKLLIKYWTLRNQGRLSYCTPDFSLEFTIELFKQEYRFDKLSTFINFIMHIDKHRIDKSLEDQQRCSYNLLLSSLHYLKEIRRQDLSKFKPVIKRSKSLFISKGRRKNNPKSQELMSFHSSD